MDVSDEIDSMDETTFDGFPFILACRGVSTKGKDVTAPILLCFLIVLSCKDGIGDLSK
jgi:hypothetical protein